VHVACYCCQITKIFFSDSSTHDFSLMIDCGTRHLHILEVRKTDIAIVVGIPKQNWNLARATVDPVSCHLCLSTGCPNDNYRLYIYFFKKSDLKAPIPVPVRSQASVCSRLLAGIVGSIPARDMDVCFV
jgi:hypothetical protein